MKTTLQDFKTSSLYQKIALLLFCWLTVGVSNHSTAQISTATITVNSAPSVATASITSTQGSAFCNGLGTTLEITGGSLGTGGAAWTWYDADVCATGAPAMTAIGSGATFTPPSSMLANSTTANVIKKFYVRAEGGTCSASACKSIDLTIYPTPTVTPPPAFTACYGTPIPAYTLSGTPSSGLSFAYSGGSLIGLPDNPNTNHDVTALASFTASNAGTSELTKQVIITPMANGCVGTSVSVGITVLPQIIIGATNDVVVCNGLPVIIPAFTSNVTGGSGTMNYTWQNTNPSAMGNGTATSGLGNIPPANGYNISCTDVIDSFIVLAEYTAAGKICSSVNDSFLVTVHPTPNGNLTAGSAVCAGDPIPLSFDATCGLPNPSATWTISIAKGTITAPTSDYTVSTSGQVINLNASQTPDVGTATTYNLMKIVDQNGCVKQ